MAVRFGIFVPQGWRMDLVKNWRIPSSNMRR